MVKQGRNEHGASEPVENPRSSFIPSQSSGVVRALQLPAGSPSTRSIPELGHSSLHTQQKVLGCPNCPGEQSQVSSSCGVESWVWSRMWVNTNTEEEEEGGWEEEQLPPCQLLPWQGRNQERQEQCPALIQQRSQP